MRANLHTHCDYCDGRASLSAMCDAASGAGYSVLGFSSHCPMPFPTGYSMRSERLGGYVEEARALARSWAPRGLEVLVGLEGDWLGGYLHGRDEAERLGLDFLIGSTHYVALDGCEPFTVDESACDFAEHVARAAGGEAGRIWKAYYRALCGMIEAGGFDVLGHFDLVRRNNSGSRWFDEDSAAYNAAALEAAELLGGRGIVVEVNLGAMARGALDSPYPSLRIMRELRARGVAVTFCADAHERGHLGVHLDAARGLARAAGYRSVAVLSAGSWREVGIDET